MMHPIYMPFTEQQVACHFAQVKKERECLFSAEKHLKYYRKSLANYETCPKESKRRKSLKETRGPCQVEKDEKFWTAACLMTLFYSKNRAQDLIRLLRKAYGDVPPVGGGNSWEECLEGELHLFLRPTCLLPRRIRNGCERIWKNASLFHIFLARGRAKLNG